MSEPGAVLEAISHDKVCVLTLGPELSLCPSPSIVLREGRSLQNPTCVRDDCDSRLGNVAVTHRAARDSGRSEITKLSTRVSASRRSLDPQPLQPMHQRCSIQAQLYGCSLWSSNFPAARLQGMEYVRSFGVSECHWHGIWVSRRFFCCG